MNTVARDAPTQPVKEKALSSQVSFYFLGKVASIVIAFVVPAILVRIFSRSEYGQYAQVVLLYGFSVRVLQFGFRQSLFYYLPSQPNNRRYFLSNTYLVFLALGFSFFATCVIFREPIARYLDVPELVTLLPLCGLLTLLLLVASPLESVLIIDSNAERASAIVFLSEVLRGIFVLTFVYFDRSIASAIIGLICFAVLRFCVYSFLVFRHLGFQLDRGSIGLFREQIDYALPIGFSGVLANTSKRFDKLVMASMLAPELYAIYSVGSFKAPLIKTFFQSVGEVLLPRAVRQLKEGKKDEFIELWRGLLVRFFFVGCAAFFTLELVAHDLITLIYTNKYEASVPIFRVLLLLLLGEMFRYGLILRTLGETKAILKSNVLAFVVAIPLTLSMVHWFGPIGAAVSAVVAFGINSVSQLRYSVIALDTNVGRVFPIHVLVKLLVIGGTLLALLAMVQPWIDSKFMRLVLSATLFLIAYVTICERAQIFNLLEERAVKRVLSKMNLARSGG